MNRLRKQRLVLIVAGVGIAVTAVILLAGNASGALPSSGGSSEQVRVSPTPSVPQATYPRQKQQYLDQVATQLAQAAQAAQRSPRPTLTVPPKGTLVAWRDEIVDPLQQAPFSRQLYILQSEWRGDRGGSHIQVYAGADAQDTTQGLLVVLVATLDFRSETQTVIRTPTKVGLVRIVGQNGDTLTIRAQNGATFTFNVVTRTLTPQ